MQQTFIVLTEEIGMLDIATYMGGKREYFCFFELL